MRSTTAFKLPCGLRNISVSPVPIPPLKSLTLAYQYFSVKPKTGRLKVVPNSVRLFNAIQEIFVARTGN